MANNQPLFYTNEKHGKSQVRYLSYQFQITAAKTIVPVPRGQEILTSFDAIASQAVIDAYLGTTNEFLLAQFDATSMGTDAFGGIINMLGQAGQVISVNVVSKTGTNLATQVVTTSLSSAPMASSSLTTASQVGANGNIAFRAVVTGLDALTSGVIEVVIKWIAV